MHAFVDDSCIGCGLCANTCPAVFTMADTGKAVAVDFANCEAGVVAEAADACPVSAIHVE